MRPVCLTLLLTACSDYELEKQPDEPTVGPPDIVVEPSTLAWDAVAVGCPYDRTVTISNVGETPLEVTGSYVEGDDGWSAEFVEATISPGSSVEMIVRLDAPEAGALVGTVVITSDDPDEPESTVPTSGTAALSEIFGESFLQEADPVDVLWVIDNSSSMGQEQARVIAEISAFYSWFVTLNLDYHMGVVTSDVVTPTMGGRLQGSPLWIDSTTANAEAELAEAINVGTDDQGNESGLHASELALSEPLLSGENAGFYRDHARLAVIYLSDEPEQSEYDAQHFIDFFTALKPDPSSILISAIVGDQGAGCATVCDGLDQTAQPGDKYLEVVSAFSGVFGSICTCDLSPTLDEIGMEATLFVRAFPLSETPSDPSRIEVWVDSEASTDWTYDAQDNAIVFGTPPVNGQQIDVQYPVALECPS